MKESGFWYNRRRNQSLSWVQALVHEALLTSFEQHPAVAERMPILENMVAADKMDLRLRRPRPAEPLHLPSARTLKKSARTLAYTSFLKSGSHSSLNSCGSYPPEGAELPVIQRGFRASPRAGGTGNTPVPAPRKLAGPLLSGRNRVPPADNHNGTPRGTLQWNTGKAKTDLLANLPVHGLQAVSPDQSPPGETGLRSLERSQINSFPSSRIINPRHIGTI